MQHVQWTQRAAGQMVRHVQAQQGLDVDVLAVRIVFRDGFADVGPHGGLLVALRVVVADCEGGLAEACYGEILFFDVGAVCGQEGLGALRFAEVCEGALERFVIAVVGRYAAVGCLARYGS